MGEPSTAAPGPPVIVLRVTVKAPDLDTFINRYSRHIAGDRIFIFSKTPQPVGTRVRFALQLQSGEPLIHGRGTVTRMQADTGDPRHPPGMELAFVPLDERSQTLIDFMMATRAGLTEDVAPLVRAVVPPPSALARLPPPAPRDEALLPPALPPPPAPAASASPPGKSPPGKSPPGKSPPGKSPPGKSPPETSPSTAEPPAPAAPSGAPPWAKPGASPSTKSTQPWPSRGAPPPSAAPPAAPAPSAAPPAAPAPSAAPPAPPASAAPSASRPRPAQPVARPPSLSLDVAWKTAAADVTAADAAPAGAAAFASAAAAAAPDPAAGEPTRVDPADGSPSVAAKLAEILPIAAPAPVVPGPAPAFAETWRDAPPDAPAAANGDVPANPFGEVSDTAIEYFVEWSIEQSIGPRSMPEARFFDVPMALPGKSGPHPAYDPPSRRALLVRYGATFAAGLLLGGLGVASLRHAPRVPDPVAVAAAAPSPPPAQPSPAPAPAPVAPPAAAPTPAATAELTVSSRPPGATVSIDGAALGATPLVAHVAPGRHQVVVAKERYATATSTSEAPGRLELVLHRPRATLRVTSTPPAADVVIGGERRGRTPLALTLPAFESYDVRVVFAGARPWRRKIYLRAPSSRVEATLALARPAAKPARPPHR